MVDIFLNQNNLNNKTLTTGISHIKELFVPHYTHNIPIFTIAYLAALFVDFIFMVISAEQH